MAVRSWIVAVLRIGLVLELNLLHDLSVRLMIHITPCGIGWTPMDAD